ncbi:hemagglutinin repeat-containing protein [Leclercia adecarboxylata]|uniref:hemagglutinin repeat-containing protein n=1 Tax=Leclercia adecarboxylata TaxID=83655 RepID=UPI002DB7506B|nr:hemagglutinin repeat-containing protein [Leclercia adecarboxylata]MEB6380839.1 hemagglutinin repeat-containing protein [Leclercia adecarboxylata]
MKKEQASLSQRVLSTLLSVLIATQPLLPAVAATITPTGNTQLDHAANGVPVVNIAPPNAAGISHNKYQDYNVGKEGLILNNATGKANQTQLGGLIQGNPNLTAGREAAGIINEVTGTNRSQLQGYTEVAGKAANVIVANPYGITCNGCGFINTPNATLTTGKPVLDANGRLQSLDVSKGSILIEGQGLDGSQSDAVSIIARATDVNAQLHAKSLSVVAGANRVAADGSISPIPGEGDAPKVAVDTGALGGMYANRIRLVSSEKGVGVNLGNLNAREGDISLDASGKLTLKNSLASGAITAKGESLALSGDHKAGGDITLNSQRDLALHDGSLNSDRDLVLNASGTLSHSNAKLTAGRDVSLAGQHINQDARSETDAARHISVNSRDSASLSGRMTTGQNLSVNANTLTHNGALVAGNTLSLNADRQTLDGAINATGDVKVAGQQVTTTRASQIQGRNLSMTAKQADLQGTQAAKDALTVNASDTLLHSGKSSADTITLTAPQLDNSGVAIASALNAQAQKLTNAGLLQGDTSLRLDTRELDNLQNGTLYSAANLTLAIPTISNSGLIISDGTLAVTANSLTGAGLLQGTDALTLSGENLSQGAAGRWLTAGTLDITAGQLTTAGLAQGQDLSIDAGDWRHTGSALATGDFDARATGSLLNKGDLMSQGNLTFSVPQLTNYGNLLAAGDMLLTGAQLTNSATVQGNTVGLSHDSLDNAGTVIGLNGLRLDTIGTLNNRGDLLSQQALTVNGGDITNSGRLQGQNIALAGTNLTNSGAIQSALDLALTLSGDMAAVTGSKITALNSARIAGKALDNQGLLSAKNLTVDGESLSNGGEMSGVNGLNLQLTGHLRQLGKMLSGAGLTVRARDISNSGQMQGDNTQLDARTLTNDGHLQGDSGLTLTLLDALTNQTDGTILSQNALAVTAPVLSNNGTIQGNGASTLNSATQVQNNGNILSGDDLTLTTADYHGAGWLQATSLVMNVAKLANSGTLMATRQATFTGNSLTNAGTLQAAQLTANAQTLTNSGTLLGNNSLTLNSDRISNDNGNLFSGGDLLTDAASLSGAGQIVALGNLTLKLVDSWTAQGVIAANDRLSVTSQGDIVNQSILQGNGITLNAAGKVINNGQITAGGGTTSLSGSQIAMNNSGSLQAGGDVSLSSLGDITLDGFTGTAGNMALTAAGSVINTALLYAGNNLSLFADRIHNQRGDMLAGNDLVMQKDASGAANSEVINTSGNIETTHGDITIKTGHLLNTRDGLATKTTQIDGAQSIPGMGDVTINVDISQLADGTYGMTSKYAEKDVGPCGTHSACNHVKWNQFYYAMYAASAEQKFINSQTRTDVTSNGGASRIASGKNLTINAGSLENFASNIMANGEVSLAGSTLNNQSWQSGTVTDWLVYQYDSRRYGYAVEPGGRYPTDGNNYQDVMPKDTSIAFTLKGHDSSTEFGEIYRSVIQAGGKVFANFSNDISNTNTTANAGKISNTITKPNLNTPSAQSIGGGVSQQALADAGAQTITGPDWKDSTVSQTIGGGTGLASGGMDGNYPLPSGNNGYFVSSTDPDSPYLITVNPKLDGLGQLDPSLFGDLWKLLGVNPGAAPRETASQYTDTSQFLGSSYMLDRIGLKPDRDYRFLGDAAFDTRYVSNYVLNQTGTRYISGLGSDLDQMRYLMDSAAGAQTSLGLKFGVALTADQIAALDHSILWWETATVNGQTVMVPKVYLSPKDVTVQNGSVISGNNVQLVGGNVINSGSSLLAQKGLSVDSSNSISNLNAGLLSAGGGLNLSALGDINNIGSSLSGKAVALESVTGSINNVTQTQAWDVDAGRVRLSGTDVGVTSSITATDGLVMRAGQDINITGANVAAGGSLGMAAGNDITITANEIAQSETRSPRNSAATETASVTQQRSTLSAGDDLTLLAGNDLNARAAAIAAEGDVGIQAGRDVNLLAEATSESASSKAKKKTAIDESVRQQGTEIASGGNAIIIAGRDMNAQAAEVTAQGDIGVAAGRDVNLTTATESDYRYREKTKTSSGFLSKKTTHTIQEDSATREKGSLLSGDNVTVTAGNNLRVLGSAVAGDGDVALSAGNNVDIVAATNTDTSWRFKETKKSGLMGTGGIGFTIGSSKSTQSLREQGTTQSGSFSTVGSTGGDVSITAGKQAHIGGADIIAQQDIRLTGDSVVIAPGHDRRTRDEKYEQKSSGLTVALSGTAGSAVNSAVTTAQSAKQSSDSRLAALKGTQAALSGVQAGQAVALDQARGTSDRDNNNTLGVSASLGSQSSKSSSHTQSETTKGSSLSAGNNVTIKATGSDITVAGSQIKAGQDVTLDAARDVNLLASQDTQQTTGKNSSSGGSIGVGLGVGSGGAGISISANASSSKGHEKGNGVWQNETTVDAGNRVTISTGRDATLAGAQVSGDAVVADIGRDLTIASTQDSDHYNNKQHSISGGLGYTFGAGGFSGSISASRDKMRSDYDSVQEQSGIFAGKGGFDVTVGNHTQLDGGVIASTAGADRNRLDTGTLGFSDIHNRADFKTEHQGAGFSSGGSIGGQFAGNMANGLLAGGGNSGDAQGTTRAAVSGGTLTVRDTANQQQHVADLSRVAEHANGSISPIFDKEKEQRRLQEVQLIAEIGSQAADIARTQGEINGLNAARAKLAKEGIHEPGPDATEKVKADYQKALRETSEYKTAMEKYGTGSTIQRGIQAATAALSGLAGGDIAGALAGAAAPELAYAIGHRSGLSEDDVAGKAIAHAILGGAVAALQGNSATAGAAGAAAGELAAKAIAGVLYPDVKDLSKLSEEQKQTVSALATISAGMAGGLAGDSTGAAAAGAGAGKNAAENNLLGGGTEEGQIKAMQEHAKNVMSCNTDPGGAACQKGLAMQDALMVTLPAGLGGGVLAAATPEIAAAAQVAIRSCTGNVVLCLNSAGIQVSEAIVPGGVGAGGAVGIGKSVAEATAAKVEASAANAVKNRQLPTGTVFDSIKATQPAIPGTSVPKSFELNVNGQTVWVNANATKHMGEYLTRNGLSHSTTEGSQAMLTSLQNAVKDASLQGMKFNEKMQVGRWELIFSQRPTDPYPVLKHALYK